MSTTQNAEILSRLKSGRTITTYDAFKMGCSRLSGRIYDLKGQGHDIRGHMIEVEKANGETARVKEYFLAPESVVR